MVTSGARNYGFKFIRLSEVDAIIGLFARATGVHLLLRAAGWLEIRVAFVVGVCESSYQVRFLMPWIPRGEKINLLWMSLAV